jgi:hypothetical protein
MDIPLFVGSLVGLLGLVARSRPVEAVAHEACRRRRPGVYSVARARVGSWLSAKAGLRAAFTPLRKILYA